MGGANVILIFGTIFRLLFSGKLSLGKLLKVPLP